MDADQILEAEELLRDIWQQQGYVWPGPRIASVAPERICALCRRSCGIAELTDLMAPSCPFCHSGS
ncbi:hypothetical protein ACRZF6_003762 [Citrobacter freundii]|uniref:hypothetical protein n=1 Tax=Salmonella enterica TaxID=28901 RepID=UPI002570DFD5|nr:hypothetical protein [Salmonella enterica]MDL4203104.1 hypothetical protein [Salmonella enterica]